MRKIKILVSTTFVVNVFLRYEILIKTLRLGRTFSSQIEEEI